MSSLSEIIADLPCAWEYKPLKAVASYVVSNVDKVSSENELPVSLCNYTDVYKNEFITPSMKFMRATAKAHEVDKFGLKKHDVVITKDSESWDDIAVPALVKESTDDLVCGYHLAVIRPMCDKILGGFVFRCLQSRAIRLQLELAATGVTRFGLPKDEIGKLRLPIPPLITQHEIIDYLDAETAQIDALIAEKEQMLKLLAEKRAVFVSQAVTMGVDSTVLMKSSGLEWLASIPIHWDLRRGKYLFKQSTLPVADRDEIVTCFRDGQVTLRKNRRVEGFTNAVQELGYQGIRVGQLVLHSMDAFAGAIGVSDSDGKCSPEYIVCDPLLDQISNEYYGQLLRVMALRGFIIAACSAVRERAPRIRFSHLADMFLPVPPVSEQKAIVESIRVFEEQTIGMESDLKKSVELLKERRSALITAAVTGQLDLEMMQA